MSRDDINTIKHALAVLASCRSFLDDYFSKNVAEKPHGLCSELLKTQSNLILLIRDYDRSASD